MDMRITHPPSIAILRSALCNRFKLFICLNKSHTQQVQCVRGLNGPLNKLLYELYYRIVVTISSNKGCCYFL